MPLRRLGILLIEKDSQVIKQSKRMLFKLGDVDMPVSSCPRGLHMHSSSHHTVALGFPARFGWLCDCHGKYPAGDENDE